MEPYWKSVYGHFTWPDFYRWLANDVPSDPVIVELGTHSGQSASCLAIELVMRLAKKQEAGIFETVSLILVDTNDLSEARKALRPIKSGSLAVDYLAHTLSWDAANRFADGTVDAVYIDADHARESVARDIAAWWPKLKRGGIMAGHDFSEEFPGVVAAVIEAFPAFAVHRGIRFCGPMQADPPGRYYPTWHVRKGTD